VSRRRRLVKEERLRMELLFQEEEREFLLKRRRCRFGRSSLQILQSKLHSCLTNPQLSISSINAHHAMIVFILILDYTSLLFASSSRPSLEKAFDRAYLQYISSDIHHTVITQFSAPSNHYSIEEFTQFIIQNRLPLL